MKARGGIGVENKRHSGFGFENKPKKAPMKPAWSRGRKSLTGKDQQPILTPSHALAAVRAGKRSRQNDLDM
jgi:hypothetical protein